MEQDLESSGWLARRDFLGFGAVGAAIGILTWRAVLPPAPGDTDSLSVAEAEARARTGQITLVDICTPEEWAATGIGVPAPRMVISRS